MGLIANPNIKITTSCLRHLLGSRSRTSSQDSSGWPLPPSMDPMGRHHPRSGAFSLVGARWLFWTLSRWTTFFPARGSFLMRLSLLSLLKTSLPLLEGAGKSTRASLLWHLHNGSPFRTFCPSASFLATSPDQTLSRTPRDTGLSVLGTQTPAP